MIDISRGLFGVYIGLTGVCFVSYAALGMAPFDALVHALTTVSTGGFSTSDQSFAAFPALTQYAAILFMILASIPFIRLFQAVNGTLRPLWSDPQIRTYLAWLGYAAGLIVLFRVVVNGEAGEETLRSTLFNVVSFFSGTGYGSADVTAWGSFPFIVLFLVGAIGGCTGSTGCSIKVFRYQILLRSIVMQIRAIHMPRRVLQVRYGGRQVDEQIIDSIILMFTLFSATFLLLAIGISMTGLPFLSAITAAWTAIFNVGPAFGPDVSPSGSLEGFPDAAKWMMIVGMFLGRLELVAVIVLFMPRFWRS